MNGDIISLFHVATNNNLPLYSHPILLDDGSQEVSCHGNGHEENNKVHKIFSTQNEIVHLIILLLFLNII